jgi:hypothetical protein
MLHATRVATWVAWVLCQGEEGNIYSLDFESDGWTTDSLPIRRSQRCPMLAPRTDDRRQFRKKMRNNF